MTHTDSAGATPSWRAMAGSAMLATAESSTAIVTAMAIANMAHWRCGFGRPSGWITGFRARLRRVGKLRSIGPARVTRAARRARPDAARA